MPAPRLSGWTFRLADLLGAPPDQAIEEHLDRLITGSVREDADLDYKQEQYGESNEDKREFAADIAAMANYRGGLIIIGIRDENEVAAELTPVRLDPAEERRMRQIAAERIAPHLDFRIRSVQSGADASIGYYLLIVPPSTLRPHLVKAGRTTLGVPVRDGATKRWLAEPEIADAYRDRYRLAIDQAARVSQVLDEGLARMDHAADAFLAVAMVPTGRGP
jgi:predicted HTH transcriptional regulator